MHNKMLVINLKNTTSGNIALKYIITVKKPQENKKVVKNLPVSAKR